MQAAMIYYSQDFETFLDSCFCQLTSDCFAKSTQTLLKTSVRETYSEYIADQI